MAGKRKIAAEANTIGEVLRRPAFYRVPTNQRDFAWTQEEVDVLWQDLTSALAEDRDEYFLGAIVLSPIADKPNEYEIVDGQQRLASLSMMLSAISNAWGDKEQAQEVFDTYLGTKDRRTRETCPKLTLNATNAAIFQQVVIEHQELSPARLKIEHRSNQLMVKAYGRIAALLKDWTSKQTPGDGNVFEFVPFAEDQSEPFPDLYRVRPGLPHFAVESVSLPLFARTLGRADEPWLIQTAVNLRVVETHFATVSDLPVVQLTHLQMSVKLRRTEIDALFLATCQAGTEEPWRVIVTCEAKQARERILEPQIINQAKAAFGRVPGNGVGRR